MKKRLDLVMDIGEQMLINGAEVHRVEDTVSRICYALGAKRVDVFIITSSMLLTLHDENGIAYTQTRRIEVKGNDFNKISKLNALSRKICSTKTCMSFEQIKDELNTITQDTIYPYLVECFAYVLIACAFTLFFGGNVVQSIVAGFIGLVVRFVTLFADKYLGNKIFSKFIASFVISLLSFLFLKLKIVTCIDHIVIGNIMVLIPGIGLTNSIRDLFTGDSLSGSLRFIEALLTAFGIAMGYVVCIFIFGTTTELCQETFLQGIPNSILQIITGMLGSFGFGLLFNIKGKHLIAVSLGGGFAWAICILLEVLTKNEFLSYFAVSILVSLYAEVMARLLKSPTTVFITPSLIPLIPGASLYYTMRSMFGGTAINFIDKAVVTVELASALALGVIVSTAIFKIINKLKFLRKLNKNRS